MRSKILVILVIALVVAGGIFVLTKNEDGAEPRPASERGNEDTRQTSGDNKHTFNNPKKSAHYETNTPAHGAVLAAPPINIVIDFNFDLAAPSAISVMGGGKEYAVGDVVIDRNKLAMRRSFDPTAPDGVYKVSYKACWPDQSCHDGHFEFAIDRSGAASYQDLTGKKEVTVRMSQIAFQPKDIKISRGTKITWVNDDEVEHYVNTDSHPAHTYYVPQNSSELKKGGHLLADF